jgi:hypothetical protein
LAWKEDTHAYAAATAQYTSGDDFCQSLRHLHMRDFVLRFIERERSLFYEALILPTRLAYGNIFW